MSDLTPAGQSPFDAICRISEVGAEYWSARDLMPLLGYEKWERFAGAIERAEMTATNQGAETTISRIREMVAQGGAERIDYRLSRFGAYLVAMNGDPRKPEVAAEGWLFRGQGRRRAWRAYQSQVDTGRLVEKMGKPFLNERTGETELPEPTIRVTAKGLAELHKRLGGDGAGPAKLAVAQ